MLPRLALVALLWVACAIPQTAYSIVGGKLVRPADGPAVAWLRTLDEEHCSAALVGPRLVLTAAHDDLDGRTWNIQLRCTLG